MSPADASRCQHHQDLDPCLLPTLLSKALSPVNNLAASCKLLSGPRPLEKLVTSGPSRAAQTTSCHVYV